MHFSQLVLFGQQLVDGFLNFRPAVIVSILRSEQRQTPDGGIGQAAGLSWHRISRLAGGCCSDVRTLCLRTTEFFKLPAKFRDPSLQRADARVVVGIDLSEPLELRLRGDHLACDGSRGVQHRLTFLLDIKCVVLAGELCELVGGIVQVLFDNLEALLKKRALAVRGRS